MQLTAERSGRWIVDGRIYQEKGSAACPAEEVPVEAQTTVEAAKRSPSEKRSHVEITP